ncbi:hypothetical protein SUGI_0553900 [Cryptomeria japonica]|nr:hypothetical protein SUGI_0553900 [Cryptomeria japonica]
MPSTFFETKEFPTGLYDIKNGYLNRRTAWWDGSAVYGNNSKQSEKLRRYKDGLSVLQALFIKEHNAICDMLKGHHHDLEDGRLYHIARFVTTAIIAKIHTIDWTVELLNTDTLLAGIRSNWYGLLGKRFKDKFGHTGSSI